MFNKYSDLQEAANDKSVYEHRALGGSGVRRIGRQQFLWMTRHSGCLSMDVVRSCLYIVTNIGIIDEGDAENGMSILSTLHQRKGTRSVPSCRGGRGLESSQQHFAVNPQLSRL